MAQVKLKQWIFATAFAVLSFAVYGSGDSEEFDDVLSQNLRDLKRESALNPYANFLVNHDFFLRPIFPIDHISLRPLFMNPERMKHFRGGEINTEVLLEKYIKEKSELGLYSRHNNWILITHDGIAGFVFTWVRKKGVRGMAYGVVPNSGKRGIITKASKLVIDFFKTDDFEITIHPENPASIAVSKRLGFKQKTHYTTCNNSYLRLSDEEVNS